MSGGAALARRLPRPRARASAVLTDDGLYRQPWFLESFLELGDDLDGAAKAGKRFAIMWELRGCPYCKETHLVNFARPGDRGLHQGEFRDPAAQHRRLAQGERISTAARSSEKALAAKYGVRFTPTFQFFPETPRRPRRSKRAGEARGRARAGLSASRTISSRCSASCARRATRRSSLRRDYSAKRANGSDVLAYCHPGS